MGEYDLLGLKKMAWIECNGDARAVIGAVHRLEDDSYEIDPKTGAAKVISTLWTWKNEGFGINPKANEVIWLSQQPSIDKEPWVGEYTIDIIPTYPDGTPAYGYLGNSKVPWEARLYDACATFDLNGSFFRPSDAYEGDGDNTGKLEYVAADGSVKYFADMSFGKDPAAPFWNEYDHNIADFFVSRGIDGFWVDNYSGWDSVNNTPTLKMFGRWSEEGFKSYLKEHPELGIADTELNIREYIKAKAEKLAPEASSSDLYNYIYRDEYWLTDTVWQAYKSYRSFMQTNASASLYAAVKSSAVKAGRNPDDVVVAGNDFCMMTNAAMTGDEADIVSTEYTGTYHPITEFNYNGMPPIGRAGNIYSLIVDFSRSNRASVWHYAPSNPNHFYLGLVVGYEALAHNITVNGGDQDTLFSMACGDESAKVLNKSIGEVRELFGNRQKYGNIAIYHSPNSEYYYLTPGGYFERKYVPASVGYLGWATALGDLDIPYIAMQEYKVTRERLNGIDLLIMPGVVSIDTEMIDNVLKPFLDDGGAIILTGENLGSVKTRNGNYMPHGKNLLEELARTYSGSGKIIIFPEDPAVEFYNAHIYYDRSDLLGELILPIRNIMSSFFADGTLDEILKVEGFGDNHITTVNYDKYTNTFFVDISDMNVDIDAGTVLGNAGGKISVILPERMQTIQGKDIKVTAFKNDGDVFTELTHSVSDGRVSVTVPPFEIYASLIFTVA